MTKTQRWIVYLALLAAFGVVFVVGWQTTGTSPRDNVPHLDNRPKANRDIASLLAQAEKGEAKAQFELGAAYSKGQSVNFAEAARWYRRAAEQGHAGAQASLGELYEAGQGVPQDSAEALRLYRASAEQGDAGAQYTMGFLYESGRGIPKDQAQAVKWYRLAAEQGEPIAQYDLGQRYDLGVGVGVDRTESLKWLMLAAANGQKDAAERMKLVRKSCSRAEISEAERRVASFSPTNSLASGRK